MKKIRLDGYVGIEITSKSVFDLLKDGNVNDELEVNLNTPGGFIYQALDIYKQIKDYPGKKTILMGGLIASAGTFIAAVDGAEIVADSATAYMIHNAEGMAIGDYREMVKEADFLRKTNKHIANRLAELSKKDVEEIINMMNEETWLYGQEIVDAGFAHRLADSGQKTDKEQAIAFAKKEYTASFERAVAFAKEIKTQESRKENKPVTKDEAVNFLKADMKPEDIAKTFNLALADLSLQARCDAAEKIVKDNAEIVRQAQITAKYGMADAKNQIRAYVEKITMGMAGDDLVKAIDSVKDDPIAKTLAAQAADMTSDINIVDSKTTPEAPVKGPRVVKA